MNPQQIRTKFKIVRQSKEQSFFKLLWIQITEGSVPKRSLVSLQVALKIRRQHDNQ